MGVAEARWQQLTIRIKEGTMTVVDSRSEWQAWRLDLLGSVEMVNRA